MAKKNSSKTATEKAIQSSEPRVTTYKGWKGVNFVDSPLGWEPLEGEDRRNFRQTDLPSNYLMVQNNLVTTPTLGIETRPDSFVIGKMPESMEDDYVFTGITAVYRKWLFAVVRNVSGQDNPQEQILYRPLTDEDNEFTHALSILLYNDAGNPIRVEKVCEIDFFEGNIVASVIGTLFEEEPFIALAKIEEDANGTLVITGDDYDGQSRPGQLVSSPYISDPTHLPVLTKVGLDSSESADSHYVAIKYCYVNRMGSTMTTSERGIWIDRSPALFNSANYIVVTHEGNIDVDLQASLGVTGVDIYAREDNNMDYVFIGHVDIPSGYQQNPTWRYRWFGNMSDTSQWVNSQLLLPTDNTTTGPKAMHFSHHDSRMYYWGVKGKPYRLYIGGNPGAEFSIARGLGGAWVDIEPGSGFDIKGTAKWKTVQGANIITILCGNKNTNKVKRFNLVETNLTYTNEVSYKSYMYEEVSNVVGCNSRYGFGVFGDGLYSLSRYGLMLTTMAMEYNSQMKNQNVSEVIKPIFTSRLGNRLENSRLVCIDNVIYIALAESSLPTDINQSGNLSVQSSEEHERRDENPYDENRKMDSVDKLDNVILCYDLDLQVWYTFTCDTTVAAHDTDAILGIFAVDSQEFIEGLGVVVDNQIRLYPTVGDINDPYALEDTVFEMPKFKVLLETGELMPKTPMQEYHWIEQLEFRFDYYYGDVREPATILIEGIDYYGRPFAIEKKLNKDRYSSDYMKPGRSHVEHVRIEKIVESLRVRISGHAVFRLTHIVNKMYSQSNRIGTPYGFNAEDRYANIHGDSYPGGKIHHYIKDYNDLKRAVVS